MKPSRTMRAAALSGALALGLLAWLPPAQAGTFETTSKWKSCDSRKAGIAVKARFSRPASYDGPGRYMVKKWVEWDVLKAGGQWRERDRHYAETNWVKITNTDYDFVTSVGDSTNWGALYDSGWRAKVTFKLIKNRKGPRDKKVDEIQIFPTKGSFREQGTFCSPGGT